jgi:CheY-like chemotaxis protein
MFAADAVLQTPLRGKVLAETLCQLVSGISEAALPQPAAAAKPVSNLSLPGFKVLVTDDNLINQRLAYTLLTKLGCDVDTADDGQAAVSKVSQAEYHLVFMDCVMPGMDGFAATTAIRSLAGKSACVPIVALTASATQDDRERCFAVGMNDFLAKPIRPEQLASCLSKWAKA